jgi:Terpene cyclase DEP1
MITLIARAVLGVATIALIIASNRQIFRRAPSGPQLSELECVYYVIGIASVALAWYFNVRYVSQHSTSWQNPLWGGDDWTNYASVTFTNRAAQGYLFANLLLALFTVVNGSRRGVRRPWLYFVSSWFFTFVFAWAFYLATVDRQRRLAAHTRLDLTKRPAEERRTTKRFEMD